MTVFLLAVVLALAVVAYVLHPILFGVSAPMERAEDEPTEAEVRKEAVLRALRDVEYDFHAGKLDPQDYATLKGEISREALEVLREVDEERPGAPPSQAEAEAALEEEIARYRARLRAGLVCPDCENRNGPGSRFCARCGSRLPLPEPGSEPSGLEA